MKILFCTWKSICEPGLINACRKKSYEVFEFDEPCSSVDYDTVYMKKLANYISETGTPDCIFSINFIPVISRLCNRLNIMYISWTVDCPCLTLYSETLSFPCNEIFLFDRLQVEKFYSLNPGHIHHLPLGCDLDLLNLPISRKDKEQFNCDISFIGSLYTEKCKFDTVQPRLPEYMNGYIQGLLSAQQNVWGYNFIEDSITDSFAEEFRSFADWSTPPDYREDTIGIVADQYLGYKCTALERTATLQAVSNSFQTDIYTLSDTSALKSIHNRGPADSNWMMPRIFKCSKINLNITLRSIKSGIPQRVFDILGSGGFLITNYQPEIAEFFEDGVDLVMYDSTPDLLAKCEYYLAHDNERTSIARHGNETIQKHYSYDKRIDQIFEQIQSIST